MKLPFIAILLLITLLGCGKDDDDSSNTNSPSVAPRVEAATFTLDGQTYICNQITIQSSENPMTLEVDATSAANQALSFSCSPIPEAGTYTSSGSLAFVVITNSTDAFFCNNGCNVIVNEHDISAKWIDITISGTMTDLFGNNPKTLNNAVVKVFY